MVLRVLLVEADDSTRQIIAALLRKCSYRVTAVPDGLMAWETLKGGPHNIDLILTEVELPSISGYALLTLVMEHDICKNIPVIMMSSHDSISMVLKCMLKGAADFLIKPVRRNELKNLWQHVWRRQNLTAGHIPQNSPDAQHKVETASENNSTSDRSSDCATSSHKRKECTEKGCDAQGLSLLKHRSDSNLSNKQKEKYEECVILDQREVIPESKTGDWSTQLSLMSVSCNEAYNPTAQKLGEHAACAKTTIQDESFVGSLYRYNSKTLQPLFPTSTGNCTELKEDASKSPDLSSNRHSQNVSGFSQKHGANLNDSQEIKTTLVIGQSGQAELAYSIPQQLIPIRGVRRDNLCTGYGHVIPPVYHRQSGISPAWSPKLASQREQSPFSTSIHSNPEIHDSEQNHRQSDETTINSVDQNTHQQNNMEPVEELRHGSPAAGQSTSSSMCNSIADHNNSSAYGSLCSRNDGNAILVVGSEKARVPESLNDGGLFLHDRFRGMDSHRASQRDSSDKVPTEAERSML
ncbi:hypothetical protein GH714_038282 [Hevea brasiliensis]|uniref:Response regulatory domain-containing protein n=1 Tax=Hevea brasiliensis TaxID=3981 RepID=A0A6A6MRE1_HEVBR|nr:hypothetical protein GH714_038282 [Hevea brasiliensis]